MRGCQRFFRSFRWGVSQGCQFHISRSFWTSLCTWRVLCCPALWFGVGLYLNLRHQDIGTPYMSGNRIRPLNTGAETDDSILLDRASLTAQADKQGPKIGVQVDRDFTTAMGTKYALLTICCFQYHRDDPVP